VNLFQVSGSVVSVRRLWLLIFCLSVAVLAVLAVAQVAVAVVVDL